MPRFKLTIEYDGTDFYGWQIQPDARTVEGDLEKAARQVLQREVDIVGQGRTDAGVHARGQVAHVDLDDTVNPKDLIHSINRITKEDVFIRNIEQVNDDFHARFDAFSRSYEYRLLKKPSPLGDRFAHTLPRIVNEDRMLRATKLFLGEHDFGELSKKNEEIPNTRCLIHTSEFEDRGDLLVYKIEGNRFLRNMVRRIIGALIMIGEDKLTELELKGLLRNEHLAPVKTAPAKGLILERVTY